MATYYYDSNAATNGDGLTAATPYNTETGTAFGTDTWYLFAGSTWDMGGTQGTTGNNCQLLKHGDGADPVVTGSNASGVITIATANGVVFTGIEFLKTGAVQGNVITAQQVGEAPSTAGLTMTDCKMSGGTAGLMADRSDNVTITRCLFGGATNAYGIRAKAQTGADVTNLKVRGCTFTCGAGLELFVSDTSDTDGKFTGLEITDNAFIGQLGSPITMRNQANSISTTATTSVTAPSTLTRNTAWPVAWAAGKKIYLGGFTNVANFGEFTVASVSGTTLTVSETTLTTESAATGKGIYLMDADQAFIAPIIKRNYISGSGQTPMLIDNFIGGVISDNTIVDSTGSGANAAAIEMLAFKRTVVERNVIRNMNTSGTVDAMGVFADGGCQDCIIRYNHVSDLPGTAQDNSGAGYAIFYAERCKVYSNIAENCKRGFWAGGTAGIGHTVYNNVFSECDIGYRTNSSPPASSLTMKNNLVIGCTVGISDSASSVVSTNAWWQNTTDNAAGALSAVDASAITSDPQVTAGYRPMPGSPLLAGGADVGYLRDFEAKQCRGHVGAYGAATLREVL